MSHDLPVHLRYSLLVEGLFLYNAHFIITLFSLGSHHERYNEVAVYVEINRLRTFLNHSALVVTIKMVQFQLPTISLPNKF